MCWPHKEPGAGPWWLLQGTQAAGPTAPDVLVPRLGARRAPPRTRSGPPRAGPVAGGAVLSQPLSCRPAWDPARLFSGPAARAPRGVLRQGLTVLYRDAMIKMHSIWISGRDFLPLRQRGRELGLGKALSQLHRAEASGQMPRGEADFPGLRVWACHPVTPLMAYCPLPSPSVGSTCSPHRSAPRLVHGVPPEAKWTAGAGCPPDLSWGRARAQPSSHSHLL